MTKKITIPPPDAATILAARHLDETEGPVQIGTPVTGSARGAINCVLRYVATAYNAPAVDQPCGVCGHPGDASHPAVCFPPVRPEICELPHETIEEEDACDAARTGRPMCPRCQHDERTRGVINLSLMELYPPDHVPTCPVQLKQALTRAVFALKTPPPDGSRRYKAGWDDALEAAIDAVAKVFDTLDQEGTS